MQRRTIVTTVQQWTYDAETPQPAVVGLRKRLLHGKLLPDEVKNNNGRKTTAPYSYLQVTNCVAALQARRTAPDNGGDTNGLKVRYHRFSRR